MNWTNSKTKGRRWMMLTSRVSSNVREATSKHLSTARANTCRLLLILKTLSDKMSGPHDTPSVKELTVPGPGPPHPPTAPKKKCTFIQPKDYSHLLLLEAELSPVHEKSQRRKDTKPCDRAREERPSRPGTGRRASPRSWRRRSGGGSGRWPRRSSLRAPTPWGGNRTGTRRSRRRTCSSPPRPSSGNSSASLPSTHRLHQLAAALPPAPTPPPRTRASSPYIISKPS